MHIFTQHACTSVSCKFAHVQVRTDTHTCKHTYTYIHTHIHLHTVAASALADGADYMYRVNDDTEFRTAWAGAFVTSLSEVISHTHTLYVYIFICIIYIYVYTYIHVYGRVHSSPRSVR